MIVYIVSNWWGDLLDQTRNSVHDSGWLIEKSWSHVDIFKSTRAINHWVSNSKAKNGGKFKVGIVLTHK